MKDSRLVLGFRVLRVPPGMRVNLSLAQIIDNDKLHPYGHIERYRTRINNDLHKSSLSYLRFLISNVILANNLGF